MRALIEADTINESAIRAKSAEVAAAEADVAILNAKVRAESMQILTSEQQAKLKELRTDRQGQIEAALRSRAVSLGTTPGALLQRSPGSIATLRCRPCRSSSPRCGRADRCRPSSR